MKLFFSPVPHQEALDFLRTRPAVSRAVFDDLSDDLKAIAFVVTGIDDATQLQVVKNILAKLPAGTNYEDVKEQIMAVLPWAGKKAERRAELLLRHWGGIAYAAAQWQRMNRQRDVFPWWQYVTMNDPKVRATHVALGGITLRHDDPFWQGHYPPWEPLCRCSVVSLMDDDVDRMREEDKGLPPDQRRVLEGPLLKQLHDSNRLVRGMNEVYDVRTPAQKGESWIGWDPANLAAGLNIAKTQAGLSRDVFGKLQKFLKAQDLGQGVSVWDWWVARQPGGRPAVVPVAAPVARTRARLEAEAAGIVKQMADLDEELGDWQLIKDEVDESTSEGAAKMTDLINQVFAARKKGVALFDAFMELVQVPAGERGKLVVSPLNGQASQKLMDHVEKGAKIVSRWVHKDLLRPARVELDTTGREHYSPVNDAIVVSPSTPLDVVAHELMHPIEAHAADLLAASRAFLKLRAAGQPVELLSLLENEPRYGPDEVAFKDEWVKRGGINYSGKLYSTTGKVEDATATELLTMGIQRLHLKPFEFHRDDPDYFWFCVSTLQKLP